MQTTLTQNKTSFERFEIPDEIKEFVYFWNCYTEWKRLNSNPAKNSAAIEHFVSLHGKSFIGIIKFFDQKAGDVNA